MDQSLTHVYTLIESGKLSEARVVLAPMLEKNADNADVWWVYVHAVEDPADAQTALNNVLRIDPDYPGANKLMQALKQQASIKDVEPDWEDDDEDFDDFLEDEFADDDSGRARLRTLLIRLTGVIALIAVIVLAVILAGSFGGDEEEETLTPAATTVPQTAGDNTPVPIESPDTTPTVEPVDSDVADSQILIEALALFDLLGDPPTELMETDLGQTLLVAVCVPAGQSPREVLDGAMVAISNIIPDFSEDVEAVGVNLTDCDTTRIYNTIGVARDDAEAFLNNDLTIEDFSRLWGPIR